MASPQLEAVYQRVCLLQQRTNELPASQQLLFAQSLEELQTVLAELQASEEKLRHRNEALITTRQAVEAERQHYRELFEFAADGDLVTDANGRIQEANCAIAVENTFGQLHFTVTLPLAIPHP